MDAEVLSRLQDSGSRVKAGNVVGLVDGFADGDEGWLRLSDEKGDLHTFPVPVDVVVVDQVDEAKVEQVRDARRAEDEAFIAAIGKPSRADIVAAVRADPALLDELAVLVAERVPAGTKEAR